MTTRPLPSTGSFKRLVRNKRRARDLATKLEDLPRPHVVVIGDVKGTFALVPARLFRDVTALLRKLGGGP